MNDYLIVRVYIKNRIWLDLNFINSLYIFLLLLFNLNLISTQIVNFLNLHVSKVSEIFYPYYPH